MKSLLMTACILLTFTLLQAQHETLLNNTRIVGAFGAPITEFGLSNNLGTAAGGGGAIVINSFFIGGYGMAVTDFDQLIDNGEVDVVDLGHGGFWLGGTFQPYRILHLYGSARLGWGGLNIDVNDGTRFRDFDDVFVLTPEIGLELNVTKWFRLAGAVGYRHVTGVNDEFELKNEDFSGTTASITFRFGWFGRRRS